MTDAPRDSSVEVGDRSATVRVGVVDAEGRLDRFLRKLLPGAALGFLFKQIDRGKIRVNAERVKPGYRLAAGDEIAIPIGGSRWDDLTRTRGMVQPASDARLDVLFEDEAVLAVDKPAGQASHGGRDSAAAAVKGHLDGTAGGSLVFKVAPAHRLDRATSGVLVFGKSPAAQRALVAAFRERRVVKRYLALVGAGLPNEGRLEGRLARDADASGRRMIEADLASGEAGGTVARTDYRSLAADDAVQLLDLRPLTGRTHQLRAQLASAGHPIVGDRRYGDAEGRAARLAARLGLTRLFLHAASLRLPHPLTGDPLRLESPLPAALGAVLDARGWPAPGPLDGSGAPGEA